MAEHQFLLLLRSFIQDEPPKEAASWEVSALLQCAARQNLLPILAYQNKRWKLFRDQEANRYLDNLLHRTVAENVNRYIEFQKLSENFTAHGIAHMPVKGYYLQHLYPSPELRTFGDIDLLIRPGDRKRSHGLLQSLDYQVRNDWEPTYSYVRGVEYYEVHTNLMDGNLDDRADLQTYFDSAWRHARPEEGLRYEPNRDFHLIYILCHLAKHLYGGGAGIRMYLDIALFIQKYRQELDWKLVTGEMQELRLTGFFYTVLHACQSWLGVETDSIITEVESGCVSLEGDREILERLLAYTLDADLFGHLRDHSVIQLRNVGGREASKGKVLRKMIFPSVEEIQRRYTFLQRQPWLLPMAWLVRLLVNSGQIPARLREMKQVGMTEAETVEEYDEFMRKIGL